MSVQLNLETRAWYLDKFGVERPCVVVNAGMVGTVAVLSLEGEALDVNPEDVYYVPQNAEDPPT